MWGYSIGGICLIYLRNNKYTAVRKQNIKKANQYRTAQYVELKRKKNPSYTLTALNTLYVVLTPKMTDYLFSMYLNFCG